MTTISIMLDKKEEMTDGLMRTKLDLTKMKLPKREKILKRKWKKRNN